MRLFADLVAGVGFDGKVVASGVSDSAHHTNGIFLKAHSGIADDTDDPRIEIDETLDVIEDALGAQVVEQSVDGEIAAQSVFFGGTELVVFGAGSVGAVSGRGETAEGADFDHIAIAEINVRDQEAAADRAAVCKEPLDLRRRGVCGDIEVFGGASKQ